jgi:hypothetical protein
VVVAGRVVASVVVTGRPAVVVLSAVVVTRFAVSVVGYVVVVVDSEREDLGLQCPAEIDVKNRKVATNISSSLGDDIMTGQMKRI